MQQFHKQYSKRLCSLLPLFLVCGDNYIFSMDITPNEVIRMFFEHMTHTQRQGIARVSKIWNFLSNTFPAPKVVIVNTQKQKEQLTQYENIPIMTANEFAQAKNNNCPDKVRLPYPPDNLDLLCNEKIKKICFDMYHGPNQDQRDDWKTGPTKLFKENNYGPKQMIAKLKEKINNWSLYVNCYYLIRSEQNTQFLFKELPHLKTIKFKDYSRQQHYSNHFSISVNYNNSLQAHIIESYNECASKFKYEATKTPNYDPIDAIEKMIKKQPLLANVQWDNYQLNKSDFKRFVQLFENSKHLSIHFPHACIEESERAEFKTTIKNIKNLSLKDDTRYYKIKRKREDKRPCTIF